MSPVAVPRPFPAPFTPPAPPPLAGLSPLLPRYIPPPVCARSCDTCREILGPIELEGTEDWSASSPSKVRERFSWKRSRQKSGSSGTTSLSPLGSQLRLGVEAEAEPRGTASSVDRGAAGSWGMSSLGLSSRPSRMSPKRSWETERRESGGRRSPGRRAPSSGGICGAPGGRSVSPGRNDSLRFSWRTSKCANGSDTVLSRLSTSACGSGSGASCCSATCSDFFFFFFLLAPSRSSPEAGGSSIFPLFPELATAMSNKAAPPSSSSSSTTISVIQFPSKVFLRTNFIPPSAACSCSSCFSFSSNETLCFSSTIASSPSAVFLRTNFWTVSGELFGFAVDGPAKELNGVAAGVPTGKPPPANCSSTAPSSTRASSVPETSSAVPPALPPPSEVRFLLFSCASIECLGLDATELTSDSLPSEIVSR